MRFIHNAKAKSPELMVMFPSLTVNEFEKAEKYWIHVCQGQHFSNESCQLQSKQELSKNSPLLPLHPFLDSSNLLRVGGRITNASLSLLQRHPMIIHGRHPLTKLIIRTEHERLLHAGPTLLIFVISRHYHVVGLRRVVCTVTRQCITCKRRAARPGSQLMGQLPAERVAPGFIFDQVGVDYAGPFYIKYGYVRKPTVVKAYMCVFVSLSVKAVHLELVSDFTSEAFIACLRRFTARWGNPTLVWSDHGTNFIGANRELGEFHDFLSSKKTQGDISSFCVPRRIEWKFIPERSPHFGGLWEAAVKSAKMHMKKVIGSTKLTFEEFSTVLTQVEACLNSRPLTPLESAGEEGIEALTPGHFLIGRPLNSIPDTSLAHPSLSLLHRWQLCQTLVRHFWQRWSNEYLSIINKFNKWRHPTQNIEVGDILILKEDNTIPSQWPLARVVDTHPGADNLVRVVTVKTSQGVYRRPITKIILLLSND